MTDICEKTFFAQQNEIYLICEPNFSVLQSKSMQRSFAIGLNQCQKKKGSIWSKSMLVTRVDVFEVLKSGMFDFAQIPHLLSPFPERKFQVSPPVKTFNLGISVFKRGGIFYITSKCYIRLQMTIASKIIVLMI